MLSRIVTIAAAGVTLLIASGCPAGHSREAPPTRQTEPGPAEAAPATPPVAGDPARERLSARDRLTACDRDDDCVVRYVGCCESIGRDLDLVMSVAVATQDAAVQHYGEACELAQPTCPLADVGACRLSELTPVCVEGTCARRIAAGSCGRRSATTMFNVPPPFSRSRSELWADADPASPR